MVATQTRRNPLVLDDSKRWTQREFLKEKLRVRERYWRPVSEAAPPLATSLLEGTNDGESYCWIIPDGIAWRKFLPLLSHLVENSSCKLVLLESAVDLMDYRNMSPCISVVSSNDDDQERMFPESAAPQERSKIQKLLQDPSNCVIPYCDLSVREQDYDEFDMMGYAKMSISERSQHALLRAGRIIQQQAAASSKILILSTDPGFVAKFPSEDGIELTLIDKLIHSLIERGIVFNADKILELKGRSEENYRLRNTPSTMASASTKSFEHLSEEKILEGLKNKTLVKGRLNVTKENPKEAFVVVSNGDSHFVNGQLGHFNRSLHHDIVILQPLPPSEWGRPIGKRRLVHHRDDDDDNNQQGIETDTTPPVPSARVVAIVEVSQRQFVATMVDAPMNDESACLVIPMDIRIPKIRLRTSGWRRFLGNRLLVQINAWEIGSNYPSGHCVEILGPVADLETEIKCLLHENGIDVLPFSAAAMAMLPPEGNEWKVPPEEIQNRLDLRSSHRIFSVDPPGCQGTVCICWL